MKKVELYTDGACRGNPGPGGWGVLLRYAEEERELYGYQAAATNNQMELMAAIRGLEALKQPCEVVLTTDSKYGSQVGNVKAGGMPVASPSRIKIYGSA